MAQSQELNAEIARLAGSGFQVRSRTDTDAQLVKPKRFNLLLFIVLLGVFYLPVYMMQKDQTVYLYVDGDGKLKRRGNSRRLGAFLMDKAQGRP